MAEPSAGDGDGDDASPGETTDATAQVGSGGATGTVEATDAAETAERGETTDHVRVHYGMSGSVPLQLFDFVFEPTGCYVLDCGAFTPLFDLAVGRHTRRAAALDAVYDEHGVDGLLASADSVTWLSTAVIERVVLHDGGRFARPKLAVETRDGAPARTVRLHEVDASTVRDALAPLLGGAVRVDLVAGAGLF